jgi:phage shock protein C
MNTQTKTLTRSTDDKWLGGVCGGVARYLDVDPTVVRLLTVVATILGLGSVIVAYVVAWILMPKSS